MNLVLFGPPGAGKGTQAQMLCERFKLRHLSTGDVIRAAIRSDTPLGRQMRETVEKGNLIPDSDVTKLVRDIVASERNRHDSFLFDGYPRTLHQVEDLDDICADYTLTQPIVVSLEVPEAMLFERITGRRICLDCKKTFNIYLNPPTDPGCDVATCRLLQRTDDQPETVRERLRVYYRQTEPILHHYEMRGNLVTIDGSGEPPEVFERVSAILAEQY